MNSFNHYAYGAVGKWMYEVMGGIRTDASAPGYKHILIEPQPGGGFRHVRVSHMTPYGLVSSEWVRADRQLSLSVTIPPNTTATVRMRGRSSDIAEAGKPLSEGHGVRSIRQEGDDSLVDLGAGHYELRYRMDPSSAP